MLEQQQRQMRKEVGFEIEMSERMDGSDRGHAGSSRKSFSNSYHSSFSEHNNNHHNEIGSTNSQHHMQQHHVGSSGEGFENGKHVTKENEHEIRLAKLREAFQQQSLAQGTSQRKYSLIWSVFILIIFGVVMIVIVYLFTKDDSDASSVSVREICTSENVEECKKGLEDQLKDDTTAALRSPAHYMFTFGAFFVTTLFFSYSLNRRSRARQAILASLPNDEVDLWNRKKQSVSRPYQTKPFNQDIALCVHEYMVKAIILKHTQQVFIEQRLQENDRQCMDKNWGHLRDSQGQLTAVNFRTYICKSYELISQLAAQIHQDFKIFKEESVREYMQRLKEECDKPEKRFPIPDPLDGSQCDEYVRIYEEAKFGSGPSDRAKLEHLRTIMDYFRQYFSLAE